MPALHVALQRHALDLIAPLVRRMDSLWRLVLGPEPPAPSKQKAAARLEFSDDLIFAVCNHLHTLQQLAMVARVSRAFRDHLKRGCGEAHWLRVGRQVCGEAHWWPDPALDPVYATQLCVCPWVSEPVEIADADERQEVLDTVPLLRCDPDERWVLEHLRATRWAPQEGHGYGEYRHVLKVHAGAFLLTVSDIFTDAEGRMCCEYFTYVVSYGGGFRLLRDMYPCCCQSARRTVLPKPAWLRRDGAPELYLSFTGRPLVLRFGPRPDRSTTTTAPPCARVIQDLLWAAFRGDVEPALGRVDLVEGVQFHGKTLAVLVVKGGSLPALRRLLDRAPHLVLLHHGAYVKAAEDGRDDMARLIVSRLPRGGRGYCSSRLLWSVLARQIRGVDARVGGMVLDINLECAMAIACVLAADDSSDNDFAHWGLMRLLCSLCAEARRPTLDGVNLADMVVDAFLPQEILMAERVGGSLALLRARARWIAELLRPNG